MSHTLTVLSDPPAAIQVPLGWNATLCTKLQRNREKINVIYQTSPQVMQCNILNHQFMPQNNTPNSLRKRQLHLLACELQISLYPERFSELQLKAIHQHFKGP